MVSTARASTATKASVRDQARGLFRDALLVAAEAEFADKGFHAARIQDIAARAGVAVGTLYNHFEQKDELLRAILDNRKVELFEQTARQASDPRDFEGELRTYYRRVFDYLAKHRAFYAVAREAGFFGAEPTTPSTMRIAVQFRQRLEAILKRGLEEGVIGGADEKFLARMLAGSVRGVLESALREKDADLVAEGARVVDFFLRAVRPERAIAHRSPAPRETTRARKPVRTDARKESK
ncbi:MAG: TetR/AcrR family transcriptional regulator [Polyangiales bacterium]